MKKCIILRGVSGSGKTTKAVELVGEKGAIHSTDSFFVQFDGVYRFRGHLLLKFHERNLEMFKRSIRTGASPVILDNCNHRVEHFLLYVEFARLYGYDIEVIEMPQISPEEAVRRSVHHVPIWAIERMQYTWEPYTV